MQTKNEEWRLLLKVKMKSCFELQLMKHQLKLTGYK